MLETFTEKDKVLVSYLFDELSAAEAVELQDEMLLDEELFERMRVVEMNIIDGYVRHEMTSDESRRFEEKFLASPENKEKVVRAQMFHESLRLLHGEEPVAAATTHVELPPPLREPHPPRMFAALFQKHRPAFALATLTLLMAIALVAYLVLRHQNSSNPVVNSAPPAREKVVPSPAPEPENRPDIDTASNRQTPTVVPSANRNSNSPGIEIARNNPKREVEWRCLNCRERYGVERGAGDEVAISLGREALYLNLKYRLADDAPKRDKFTVRVEDEDSQPVYLAGGKKSEEVTRTNSDGESFIVIKVPTNVLKNGGRYTLIIEDPYFLHKVFTIKK
jgi:hypothetical protein